MLTCLKGRRATFLNSASNLLTSVYSINCFFSQGGEEPKFKPNKFL